MSLLPDFPGNHPLSCHRGSMRNTLILGLAGIAILIAGYVFFVRGISPFTSAPSHPSEENGKKSGTPSSSVSTVADTDTSPRVQVSTPQRKDLVDTLKIPGAVFAWEQATLYAKISGYLKWIGVDKGDVVKEGERLAEIENPEVQELYEQAEADYRIKQLTADRLLAVWEENPDLIAKQEVDVALSVAATAGHVRNNQKVLYDYRMIYAPFAGVVTARFVDPGALIQTATSSATKNNPLVTVMNFDQVRIYFNIPEKFASLVKAGLPVDILTQENGREKIFPGNIARTNKSLDPVTRTLIAEVDMSNENHQLRPGMSVMGTLYLQEHKNTLVIPPDAVITDMNDMSSHYVFIVKNGKTRRVTVTLGIDDGTSIEVLDGLTPDDEVIVVGKSSVVEGVAVDKSPYTLPSGQPAKQKF